MRQQLPTSGSWPTDPPFTLADSAEATRFGGETPHRDAGGTGHKNADNVGYFLRSVTDSADFTVCTENARRNDRADFPTCIAEIES